MISSDSVKCPCDSIANDYSWPCINTTCITCHPNRGESRHLGRLLVAYDSISPQNGIKNLSREIRISLRKKNGSKFSFDASMEFSIWLPPNTLERYVTSLRAIRNGARRKSNLGVHMEYLEASQATWKIDTGITDDGLGFCDFPSHVKGSSSGPIGCLYPQNHRSESIRNGQIFGCRCNSICEHEELPFFI